MKFIRILLGEALDGLMSLLGSLVMVVVLMAVIGGIVGLAYGLDAFGTEVGAVDSIPDYITTVVVFWLLLGYPLWVTVLGPGVRRPLRVQRGHTVVVFLYGVIIIGLAYGIEGVIKALT